MGSVTAHTGLPSPDSWLDLSKRLNTSRKIYLDRYSFDTSPSVLDKAEAAKIFVVGASGYIGGDTVAHLSRHHPEYHIMLLVRKVTQLDPIKRAFPNVEILQGDLDSHAIHYQHAKWADVVLQIADSDHEAGTMALLDALAEGQRMDGKERTYIHVSGAAKIIKITGASGTKSTKIYGDLEQADFIRNFTATNCPHASLEQKIIERGEKIGVRTAILSPPMVHGTGRGPVRRRGYLAVYLNVAITQYQAFMVEDGNNIWSQVDVHDVSNALLKLVTEALKSPERCRASWGREGHYFVESSEAVWRQKAAMVATLLKSEGWLKTKRILSVTPGHAKSVHPDGDNIFGTNVRVRAQKLRLLGWEPKGPAWEDSLRYTIKEECYGILYGFEAIGARSIRM
ncbi:MAG: hypothetical protein M1836_001995 [Candelina mexicana]|nr:MAG: hypothetical protein M1836_001995 [Candelina mexicana]